MKSVPYSVVDEHGHRLPRFPVSFASRRDLLDAVRQVWPNVQVSLVDELLSGGCVVAYIAR